MSNTLLSPVGNIKFLAVAKPVKKFQSEDLIYTIKLEFDGTSPEGLAFLNSIKAINSKKVVTDNVSKEGNYIIAFNSKYAPKVMDEAGNLLEGQDIPFFNSKIDSGNARVEIQESKGSGMATAYLKKVQLLDLELAPRDESESLGALEAAIQQEHNA
jgi:hypothetical protein